MKKLILALALWLAPFAAFAQTGSAKTTAQLNAEAPVLLPSGTGALTAYNLRQMLLDMIASFSTTGTDTTYAFRANNLSDLANASTARTNLGVTATGADTTYNFRANNLSDVANVATARTNLGVTGTGADTTYAFRANNLSDLANAGTARTNLGLGTAATQAYTQGTWTPTIITTGTVGTPAYSIQVGSYEQIGRLVVAHFTISLSGWTGSPTGTVEISLVGLPAPTSTTNDYQSCTISNYTITGTAGSIGVTGFIAPAATVAVLQTNTQTGSSNISAAIAGTTPQFIGTCTYHT